jgi:hypothetical protein
MTIHPSISVSPLNAISRERVNPDILRHEMNTILGMSRTRMHLASIRALSPKCSSRSGLEGVSHGFTEIPWQLLVTAVVFWEGGDAEERQPISISMCEPNGTTAVGSMYQSQTQRKRARWRRKKYKWIIRQCVSSSVLS